jgi:hypothetical protein
MLYLLWSDKITALVKSGGTGVYSEGKGRAPLCVTQRSGPGFDVGFKRALAGAAETFGMKMY